MERGKRNKRDWLDVETRTQTEKRREKQREKENHISEETDKGINRDKGIKGGGGSWRVRVRGR
jgi:hypothetical protein